MLELRVGVSSGPVAGIVLGACRRFYCVYGPTVNRAARMCQVAAPHMYIYIHIYIYIYISIDISIDIDIDIDIYICIYI